MEGDLAAQTKLSGKLPVGEFFRPLPLAALALLIVNDWALKPSSVSEWAGGLITGKLSDFAGLLFFPLLCTALADSALYLLRHLGLPFDYRLRVWKLALSILSCASAFAALKLSPEFRDAVVSLLRSLGFQAQIIVDPSDLWALSVLPLSFREGLKEISQTASDPQ